MAYSPDKPIVFISCGQYTDEERRLGLEIARLIDEHTAATGYFAERVNSAESLSREVLSALNNAIGFIAVMHHRGTVETLHGHHTRASVWIEQEIAIITFLLQAQAVNIPVRLYVQKGIGREGLREQLRLEVIEFENAAEVIQDVQTRIADGEFQLRPATLSTDRACVVRSMVRILHKEGYSERCGDIQIAIPAPPRTYTRVSI